MRNDWSSRFTRTALFLNAVCLMAVISAPAVAINGYFSLGGGTQRKGMGGQWSGLADLQWVSGNLKLDSHFDY